MRGEQAMQIIDAQIHIWGSGLPSNLAHRQVTAFPAEEAVGLMDEGGIDAAVIHPPGWDPGATAMAFAAVRNYPGRFAIMGAFPLHRPENRALVATWRRSEEHTSELQSLRHLVCRLLLEKKKKKTKRETAQSKTNQTRTAHKANERQEAGSSARQPSRSEGNESVYSGPVWYTQYATHKEA